jgi:hypothetical protein
MMETRNEKGPHEAPKMGIVRPQKPTTNGYVGLSYLICREIVKYLDIHYF